jgi:hypothetical protein
VLGGAGRVAVTALILYLLFGGPLVYFLQWLFGPPPIEQRYNSYANSDAKNAYTAAQGYFMEHPNGSVSTTDILSAYGFRQTENVTIIPNGNQSDLTIVTYHSSGDRTYTIHSDGHITND